MHRYQVELPLAGNPEPLIICVCDSPQAVAEVVRVLLSQGNLPWGWLRVTIIHGE